MEISRWSKLYHIAGHTIQINSAYDRGAWSAYECSGGDRTEATFSVTEGEVLRQFPDAERDELASAEEAALCSLIYHWLPQRGVMSLHASALAANGLAYAFLGPSGTGKSTHARMWRTLLGDRVTMLNDDEPLLCFDGDDIIVRSSPWRGKENLGADISAPLGALVVLEQAAHNAIECMEPADALPCVLLQTMRPRTEPEADALFILLDRLLTTTPVYRLRCTPTTDAARLCYQTLAGGLT